MYLQDQPFVECLHLFIYLVYLPRQQAKRAVSFKPVPVECTDGEKPIVCLCFGVGVPPVQQKLHLL